jgi:hypothetical protein
MTPPVRLIVVDSITNPFRDLDTSGSEDMAHRSKLLYQIARVLKETAHRCASDAHAQHACMLPR